MVIIILLLSLSGQWVAEPWNESLFGLHGCEIAGKALVEEGKAVEYQCIKINRSPKPIFMNTDAVIMPYKTITK